MRTLTCEPSERLVIGDGPDPIEVVVVKVARGRVRLSVRPPAGGVVVPAERACTVVPGWPDTELNAMGQV